MTPEQPAEWSRLKRGLEVLGAGAGLVGYVLLVGGLQQWARLAGAGLPSTALEWVDSTALLSSGLSALLIWPIALFLVVLALQAAAFVARTPKAVATLRRVVRIAASVLLLLYAVANALATAVALIVVNPRLWRLLVAYGLLLMIALARELVAAGLGLSERVRRRTSKAASSDQPNIASTHEPPPGKPEGDGRRTPALFAWPQQLLRPVWSRVLVVAIPVVLGYLAGRLNNDQTTLAWALLIASSLPLCLAMVAIVGFAWRIPVGDERAHQAPTWNAFAVLGAIGIIVYVFLLPIWVGIYALLVVAGALLLRRSGEPPRPDDILVAATIATAIAGGAVAFSARSPQRFDRVEVTLSRGRTLEAALLGETGEDVVVAACDRFHGVSRDSVVLRVPRDRLGEFAVKRSGYAFYSSTDPSLFSALAATAGLSVVRPPTIPAFLHRQFHTSGAVADVCGSSPNRLSVAEMRAVLSVNAQTARRCLRPAGRARLAQSAIPSDCAS